MNALKLNEICPLLFMNIRIVNISQCPKPILDSPTPVLKLAVFSLALNGE